MTPLTTLTLKSKSLSRFTNVIKPYVMELFLTLSRSFSILLIRDNIIYDINKQLSFDEKP